MKMKMYVPFILAILGITEFSKNEDEKFSLTEDQQNTLVKEGFNASFVEKFNAELEKNFEEPSADEENSNTDEAPLLDPEAIRALTIASAQAQEQVDSLTTANTQAVGENEKMKQTIADLNAKIKTLSEKPEPDMNAGTQHAATPATAELNPMDDKQLLGLPGEMFSLEDRPYNQRARAAMLAKEGYEVLVPVSLNPSVDFAKLEEDLGAYYRTQKRKELQSFIAQLRTVENIFPLESGIQDREVITNLFLGEFSQADSSDESEFEKVVKGKYEIQAEEIRMYDVMLAHAFKSLKKLEKQWIGYLNREGSSSIKISFVEYLLRETAKKLHNEREQRRIKGVRKNPVANVPGKALEASTGYFRFIHEKINNLQIKPFELGEITPANIGEKVFEGTKQIPTEWLDSGNIVLYMPSAMVIEYHKYNELHFGTNQDYKADIMYVKEYPDVKIIPVPNAGTHRRLVWTLEGNIKTFENVPGEMYNFRVLIKEWSLNVTTQWKEGFGAILVGKKWDRKVDMDYNHQLIWVSDTDLPKNEFTPMAQNEAVPSALYHNSLVSVANTALTTITDISDVEVGGMVTLKNGSDNFGIKIEKTGVFSEISVAWTPDINDTITLVKRQDGKFLELKRETAGASALQFEPSATTPSLAGATEFQVGINTAATTITNFTDALEGVIYTIHGNGSGANVSKIAAGNANVILTGEMTFNTGTYLQIVKRADGKFMEVARG